MLRWHGKNPIKTFRIKSRTSFNPDLGEYDEYSVELWGDGKIFCPCPAGNRNKSCYHKKEKKKELEERFGSLEEAVNYYRHLNK